MVNWFNTRILIVEDERKVAAALKEGLEAEGYEVTLAGTGEEGFFHASARAFDLIVFDIMLPGRDGLEVLSALRRQDNAPVLLLTARDGVEDRVFGLNAGEDDYLVKPFASEELSARIRALLRRNKPESVSSLRVGGLQIDVVKRTITREGSRLSRAPQVRDLVRSKGRTPSTRSRVSARTAVNVEVCLRDTNLERFLVLIDELEWVK